MDFTFDLRQTLRQYADDHGLRLILQYSSSPVSADDPQSIQRAFAQPVVYQHGLDITDEISKMVKAAPQAAQAKPSSARQ